jgi:hypothetical protein
MVGIVFLALYLLIFLAYPISVYALIKWYHIRTMTNGERSIWIPIVYMPILACIWSYLTVVLYHGAWGPGILMVICSVPLTFVNLIIHYTNGNTSQDDIPNGRWWIRLLIVLLIICMSLAPFGGLQVIPSVCNKLHAQIAEPIISALHAYEADNGVYPRHFEALVPEYLKTIPKPVCLYLNPAFVLLQGNSDEHHDIRHYHLEWCATWEDNVAVGEYPMIILQEVTVGYLFRYNLHTSEWSSVSYFDGGYCG